MKFRMQYLFGFFLLDNVIALNVTLYYEALCGDSMSFITNQLYPAYNYIGDYIKLEFVPYGKAVHSERNGKYEFYCQHGPSECRGNKYQSCVLSQNNGQFKDVEFVHCVMRHRNPSYFANIENCAKRLDLDVNKIKSCAQSEEGDKLLANEGDKTWKVVPNLSFVPTVTYNGVYNDVAQWQSLQDFVAVVCSQLDGSKPDICLNRRLPVINYFPW